MRPAKHWIAARCADVFALAGVALATAIVLDAALFGWEDTAPDQPLAVTPFCDPVQRSAGLRYAGTF